MLTNVLLCRDSVEPLLHRIENCLEDNEYEKCWNDQLKSRLLSDPIWQVHEMYIKKISAVSSKFMLTKKVGENSFS